MNLRDALQNISGVGADGVNALLDRVIPRLAIDLAISAARIEEIVQTSTQAATDAAASHPRDIVDVEAMAELIADHVIEVQPVARPMISTAAIAAALRERSDEIEEAEEGWYDEEAEYAEAYEDADFEDPDREY